MFGAVDYWVTIVELPAFERANKDLLSEDETSGLIAYLAANPDAGDLIPGTGGVRKLRWAACGKGKRGGARVIYYFRDLNMPLYLITAFSKGERIDISQADRNLMRKLVDQIVEQHWANEVNVKLIRVSPA